MSIGMNNRFDISEVVLKPNNDAELPDGRTAKFLRKSVYDNGSSFLHYKDANNNKLVIVKSERRK